MTTPPKASKFRIRRTGSAATAAKPAESAPQKDTSQKDTSQMPFAGASDGFGDQPFPTAEQDMLKEPEKQISIGQEIAAIQAEGLSGKQLRLARRVAQKNGIDAASDLEAVRLLRRKGIDPFQRSNILQLVNPTEAKTAAGSGQVQLPQTVAPTTNLPATQAAGEAYRAAEIIRLQRDIMRRRRRNFMLLMARLAVFVALPALMVGWYFFSLATPLYATRSEFLIQQAEAQGSGLGGMFQGTQFATSQDSITVQSYLQSRDAMIRLDKELGYKAHFSQEYIDPLQRLEPGTTNEAAYKLYSRNIKIGYDPTEGIIKMEVIAADPEASQRFSEALIRYAEEQVDQLTQRLREDQMSGARDSFEDAELKMQAAQRSVLDLQEELGVIDPLTETNVVMGQVSTFESQLQQKRLQLQGLLANEQPNQARVDGVTGDIQRLENLIADLRAQLTESTMGSTSLARISGQLRVAQADLETRQVMLSQSMQQLETARIEANRQVRYLSVAVAPVAPDEPTYPRAFENTVLAFLIFGGIYLMLSMTASILREQVTS
ncbi:MAG: capsule biosynthesis protein [Paracoccaceae bacterium]|nr:capsule biosynthesis protein [Paracoccaceae bacterium]